MPTTANTPAAQTQQAQQQAPTAPFIRMSELEGKTQTEECVLFIKSFGPWNKGVSAGFVSERAQWLYRHGYARRFNPATDGSALGSRLVTK